MTVNKFLKLLLLLLASIESITYVSTQIVNTNLGNIEGTYKLVGAKKTRIFLGIPFAKPPVGNLRFKKPAPVEPWDDLLRAVNLSSPCVQPYDIYKNPPVNPEDVVITGSEDCLYLNIFHPGLKHVNSENHTELLPVMVWIHGGGFLTGAGSTMGEMPYNLMAEGNVVVVTLNYRLSMLGFGALESRARNDSTESIPANLGIFDQQLAMKWVHENIENFSGNPAEITIFGESAGGASITAHLASAKSRRYFKKAIVQSGSHTCSWGSASKRKVVDATKNAAEQVGCETNKTLFDCLKNMDAKKLVKTYFIANRKSHFGMGLTVVNDDDDFFEGNALEMFASANLSSKSVMVGMTKDESSFFLLGSPACKHLIYAGDNATEDDYKKCNLMRLYKLDAVHKSEVLAHYAPPAYRDFMESTMNLQNNMDFGCCGVREVASTVSKSADKTFVYIFDYVPQFTLDTPIAKLGAYHSIELQFVMGNIQYNDNATKSDSDMSKRMISYWSRFAKFGQPNLDLRSWPAVQLDQESQISIPYKVIQEVDSPECVKIDFLKTNCEFLDIYGLGEAKVEN